MSGMMWCSVPRMRTLNWHTAMKLIVVPVLEVDETHRRALLARLAVLADTRVFQQQIEERGGYSGSGRYQGSSRSAA